MFVCVCLCVYIRPVHISNLSYISGQCRSLLKNNSRVAFGRPLAYRVYIVLNTTLKICQLGNRTFRLPLLERNSLHRSLPLVQTSVLTGRPYSLNIWFLNFRMCAPIHERKINYGWYFRGHATFCQYTAQSFLLLKLRLSCCGCVYWAAVISLRYYSITELGWSVNSFLQACALGELDGNLEFVGHKMYIHSKRPRILFSS